MDEYLSNYRQLNTLQRAAVDRIDGPLLVLAGPGTGKTQLLSVRAGSIVRNGHARPDNILIMTYTNSAAKAMKERLAKVMGLSGYDVEVGTFHSFANSIIQGSAEAADYVGDRIPMTDVERVKAVEYALDNTEGVEELRPFRSPYIYLKEILRKIGDLKKDDISPSDLKKYIADARSSCHGMEEKYLKRLRALSLIYDRYERLKDGSDTSVFDERGRYDFDDMILFAVQAMKKEAGLVDDYRRQYPYVMVDEFQDTNGAQLDLIFTIMDRSHPNLCCVGDDDQSIYRFQGASVSNFKRLRAAFPDIETVKLTRNYRSGSGLISISRKIIEAIPLRERVEEKALENVREYKATETVFFEFTTEEEELLYVVDKVKELADKISKSPDSSENLRKNPYNGIAVLVRKRDQILKVIDAFLRSGIPYATDGKEDIEGETRVRQLIDVLDLAHTDPADCEAKDLALYKVMTADYFGSPISDVLRLIHTVNETKRKRDPAASLTGSLLDDGPARARPSAAKKPAIVVPPSLEKARSAVKKLLEDAVSAPVHKLLMDYIKGSGMLEYIVREYSENGMLRIRQLRALGSFVNMIKESDIARPGIRLGEFLEELHRRISHGLPIQGSLVTLSQTGVRIYTAHASKGLEFHSVIMPFCLQNRSWPLKSPAERIRLPSDLVTGRACPDDKAVADNLAFNDETRLFYVAATRAMSDLIFTASPGEGAVKASYLDKLDIPRRSSEDLGQREEDLVCKSLRSSADADREALACDVVSDMVANMTLNPTRLNNYLACRRKFFYNDVLKLPGQKKRSLVFGNCVHKGLEVVFKAYMETGRFPAFPVFEKAFAGELAYQGVDSAMERECMNRMKTVKGWFDAERIRAKVPIDLEKKLMVTVGDNIIFTGKYDKVEWCDEKARTVRVLDYKTGKPDDHIKAIDRCTDLDSAECEPYLRQLVAYKLLFEKDKRQSKTGVVECGALVFIEPLGSDIRKLGYRKGEYATVSVPISEAMVGRLEGIIVRAWQDIRSLRFDKLAARDDKLCQNCDFDNICWG
jgi:DNA helicase-2/ATP-dependent DNA helicase PcrA